MYKFQRIAAIQDNTPSRNFANEFINEQGSCATLEAACKMEIVENTASENYVHGS